MAGPTTKGWEKLTQTAAERVAGERKRKLEKYFCKTPDPKQRSLAFALIGGAGAAALIALIAFAGESGFLGFVMLVLAAYLGRKGYMMKSEYDRQYKAAEPKPTDHEVDRLLASDLLNLSQRAMRQLGLTNADLEVVSRRWDPIAQLEHRNARTGDGGHRPLVVFGPLLDTGRAAVGADGVFRFPGYEVMVICPTSYHLAMYRCALDFLTGSLRSEETSEYHYADVVAVSTVGNPGTPLRAEPVRGSDADVVTFAKTLLRRFQIVVSSGDRSTVVVGINDKDQPDRQAILQESGIDEVISSVRRMLREKKGGVAPPPAAGTQQY